MSKDLISLLIKNIDKLEPQEVKLAVYKELPQSGSGYCDVDVDWFDPDNAYCVIDKNEHEDCFYSHRTRQRQDLDVIVTDKKQCKHWRV